MKGLHGQFDPELRKLLLEKKPTVIIPIGSIEQHGPHLPVTTDSEIAGAVAARVAARVGALVMPVVMYGVSHEHVPFFHTSVRPATMRRYLGDMCDSLASGGVSRIILLNGHYGNQKALEGLKDGCGGLIRVLSYWRFMKRRFDHAGFVETSLMLAISGNVKMSRAEKGLDEDVLSPRALARAKRQSRISFPEATGNGVWGDPTGATAEDGRAMLGEIVRNLAARIRELEV